MLPLAGQTLVIVRAKRRYSGMDSPLKVRLMPKRFERRKFRIVGCARADECPSPSIIASKVVGLVLMIRSRHAKVRDRGHNQTRIRPMETLEVQTYTRHLRRVIIVNEEVSLCTQTLQQRLAFRRTEIERHSSFVSVQVEKQSA